jgi:hypothetical protein
VTRVRLNADNTKAARIAMTPMATSNSTNVNAREALIEFARQRMTMAYHGVLNVVKHLLQDSACRAQWNVVSLRLPKPAERACPAR